MNKKRVAYWFATGLISLSFVTGGLAYISKAEVPMAGMAELGFPVYFVVMLGVWKLLGGIVILLPRLALLKEWAYAGIAFNLIAAAVSHASIGHPANKVIVPLILLAIASASWALRPSSRRLKTPERSVECGSHAAALVSEI